MFERLKLNINFIIKGTLNTSGVIFSIIAVVLSFISWEDVGIENVCYKIILLIGIVIISLIITSIYVLYVKNSCTVWECGNRKIILQYSDIIKQGFSNKIKKDKIIVIPVNTCFDTIVDYDLATSAKPLISPNTIHGQWIRGMEKIGISREELDKRIKKYIQEKDIIPTKVLSSEIKNQGNLLSYDYGTIVPIKGREKVTFYLLALSEFDENNNAQCSIDEFIKSIEKLVKFYNKNGQGFEVYIPLMGTNLSRVGMSHKESLHKIKSILELYSNQVYGTVNVVVYYKDKDKVSIFN